MDSDVLKLYHRRQTEDKCSLTYKKSLHVTETSISRLGFEYELKGHEGCVNCLEWNQKGTMLASGSDDLNIILWNPLEHKKIQTLETHHESNIFSVKFLPNSNDEVILSGAGDCSVQACNSESKNLLLYCHCHIGRVKRLAVTPTEPNLFWSAGEDGFIMQFDFRTKHTCANICSNILVNLHDYLGNSAEAKCLSINPMKPEMLAVGANDPYIRLYDRRMISLSTIKYPTPSANRNLWENILLPNAAEPIPSQSVQYFVAGHLPQKQIEYKKRYRTLASTYVTFSPDGTELLANLGGEQIYLFSLSNPSRSIAEENFTLKNELLPMEEDYINAHLSPLCKTTEDIKSRANTYYKQANYIMAICFYNQAIVLNPTNSVLYGNRAAALMKRGWDGDLYSALKDCWKSIQLDPSYYKSHFRLARCLFELNWTSKAHDCLQMFKDKFPEQRNSQALLSLEKDILIALQNETNKPVETDHSPNGKMTPGSKTISELERHWRNLAFDYKDRFCGHCNTTTDIKEVNYFGQGGQYIMAGSDDGSFFIWDKNTSNIMRVIRGDESIVNCLQPHPDLCLLATSGIDNVIRLWSPLPEDGTVDSHVVTDSLDAASANQKRMNTDPVEAMLLNMGYRLPSGGENENGAIPPCHHS